MDPDVANFAVVAVVIVGMAGALAAIVVGLVRALAKKPAHRELPSPIHFEQRFDQLQQSVDAIAVEVERMILDMGGKPAFPAQLSRNHVAAHYCSSPDDALPACQ